ncbi:MAG: hypothetical protein JSS49_22340 [Planctomycetes bacterium]|nr:hypothetical protein [Planctomycetota bacterium]
MFRSPLLRCLAAPLVISESSPMATTMLILGGDLRFDEAAQFCREDLHRHVLLEESPRGRLVRLGILPDPVELGRKELTRRGVRGDQIDVVSWTDPEDSLDMELSRWLHEHPQAQVIVVCEAFSSREIRWRFDRELPRLLARRLAIRPLHHRSYDLSNWWHSKPGIMLFVRSWLGLILPAIQSKESRTWRECNPELFTPAA